MSTEHEDIRDLLHAYVDGELDLANARETERHLQSCPDCRGTERAIRELRSTLTSDATAYRAPAHLRKSVRAALRREAKSTRQTLSPWLMFATGAAFAAVILGFTLFQTTRATRTNAIVDQVVANHVRSLLAVQLVDVVSSDQHTVKPWFDGKIDFAPEVRDLSANGFPLVGGRLDYLDGKTVVALVYQRNKHPINLFITPEPTSRSTSTTVTTRRGYNVFSWTNSGMKYWAVSDLNQAELREFTELVQTVK
jgi:anti-sigma factor RsiW